MTEPEPLHGVEIRQRPKGQFLVEVLFVDGEEIWCDWTSEPEDCILSRDLADFVKVIRKLAKERTELRAQVHRLEMAALRVPKPKPDDGFIDRTADLFGSEPDTSPGKTLAEVFSEPNDSGDQ